MKYSEKFWLHFKKKDYKESSNFAAENPKAYHPLGFPLLCVYPADTTKSPARRPGGFEIRRKKRFDLLKPGDLKSPNTDSSF